MSNSREMRRLAAKWSQRTGWPQFLEFLEISGLRGWDGQKVPLQFPIVALVGENGTGKSTVLQCAAAVYRPKENGRPKSESWFASDFFPKTVWDDARGAKIVCSIRQGKGTKMHDIKLPGERWRGNLERPQRSVDYIDLRRIQPIAARVGYSKLAKEARVEKSAEYFDDVRLARFSQIMGWQFDSARIALTDASEERKVPVFVQSGQTYSGYNSGSGQTTVAEFLQVDPEQYGLVLIDEIETSLHPRAQRRLIRDLAVVCRERDLQIILSTHSPYVLAELPLEARLYLVQGRTGRHIMSGVSPEFAMTRMDEYPHPECDLYVEDERARTFLREILVAHTRGLVERCEITTYGAASVGRSLGLMVFQNRFIRSTGVLLDGDQAEAPGCWLSPGGDAPEPVVFDGLQRQNWGHLADRLGRQFADVADACIQAMSLTDHHDWISVAASRLVVAGDHLWQAMCAEWSTLCFTGADATDFVQPISDLVIANPTSISSPLVRFPLLDRQTDAFDDMQPMV
jgi:predicted ATPase